MRPEHFYSGKQEAVAILAGGDISFNEAGAFLLRKTWRIDNSTCRRSGFNEAGAFLLRKTMENLEFYPRLSELQ